MKKEDIEQELKQLESLLSKVQEAVEWQKLAEMNDDIRIGIDSKPDLINLRGSFIEKAMTLSRHREQMTRRQRKRYRDTVTQFNLIGTSIRFFSSDY